METSPTVATCTHFVKQFQRNSCHLPWMARSMETPKKRHLPLPEMIRIHLRNLSCPSGESLLHAFHFVRKKAWSISVSVPCWYNFIVVVFVNEWVWVLSGYLGRLSWVNHPQMNVIILFLWHKMKDIIVVLRSWQVVSAAPARQHPTARCNSKLQLATCQLW